MTTVAYIERHAVMQQLIDGAFQRLQGDDRQWNHCAVLFVQQQCHLPRATPISRPTTTSTLNADKSANIANGNEWKRQPSVHHVDISRLCLANGAIAHCARLARSTKSKDGLIVGSAAIANYANDISATSNGHYRLPLVNTRLSFHESDAPPCARSPVKGTADSGIFSSNRSQRTTKNDKDISS